MDGVYSVAVDFVVAFEGGAKSFPGVLIFK